MAKPRSRDGAESPKPKTTTTRADVEELHRKAEAKRDHPGDYFPALARARKAEQQWREENPEGAAAEDARKKKRQADRLRAQAADALVYDADGWLGPEQRQQRHDELIAKAEAIEVSI